MPHLAAHPGARRRRRHGRAVRGLPVLGMAAALMAGCASSEQTSSATRSTPATSTPSSSPPDTPTTTGSTTQQEGTVQISLTIGSELITATLADTPTAAAFADLLPLTVNVRDFNGTEKIADLPQQLTTEGSPAGLTPTAGDLALYAPWGNLAVYYRDYAYSGDLYLLARLDDGPAAFATLPDNTAVEISLLG